MWSHSKQVTVWVVHKGSGWEAALSDFAPAKKPLNFWLCPSPCPGYPYPTRWSLAWGVLTCPLPHARNCASLAHCGTAQWEGKVGPHQPKLWTSPLGQPGCRGLEGALLWAPPSTPSLSGQVTAPFSLTHFSGVWDPGKHPRGSYLNDWCDLRQTCREPFPDQGVPLLKTTSGWHCPPWSSTARSKCAKSCPELPAVHHPHEPGGAVLLGPLSEIPWKINIGQSSRKSQGTCPRWSGGVPQRWEVDTFFSLWVGQPRVNVPNHVRSHCPCTTLANLGELRCQAVCLKFPWKMKVGWSAQNSQGT